MKTPTPEQIRKARHQAGLSQTEAGALIHCALRTWQDWEADKRQMHPAMWELFQLKVRRLK
jgi:putative transcriptional regulator